MEYLIKQLSQNSQIFFPQTSAEAVVVKDNEEITTLDKFLQKKIENVVAPAGSGLQSYKQNQNVIITHSNSIEPNSNPSSTLIKYDNRGHIIEVAPFGKLQIKVNQNQYIEYNGQISQELLMGDDFGIDNNNNIIIKWNNI